MVLTMGLPLILLALFLIFALSCAKKEEPINKNLIYFNTSFLSELGNDDYEKLLSKTKLEIKAQYIDDLIIINKYVESNACGKYAGNIRIKNDKIFLIYKLISDEVCTSTGVERVTYIINNPTEKKYEFALQYE